MPCALRSVSAKKKETRRMGRRVRRKATIKMVMARIKIRKAMEIQTKAKAVTTKANVDSLVIITIG